MSNPNTNATMNTIIKSTATANYSDKTRADFVDDLRHNPEMLHVYAAACQEIAQNCWIAIYDIAGSAFAVNDIIASYAIPFTYKWSDTIFDDPDADIYSALDRLISTVQLDYPGHAVA